MGAPALYPVRMDVAHDHEATFNTVYDTEHLPLLLTLPGESRYLCAYEVERPVLPMSKLWNDTSDIGRWKPEVLPYTSNKRFIAI